MEVLKQNTSTFSDSGSSPDDILNGRATTKSNRLIKRVSISSSSDALMADDEDDFLTSDDDYEEEEEEELDRTKIVDGASTQSSSSSQTSPVHSSFLSDSEHEHEDDEELPLIKLFQKFLDREAIKKLKLRHAQLNSKLQKLKKVVDPTTIREKGKGLRREQDKIKELIKLKKNQLNDKMNAPPFLRLMDKFAFTVGLLILCISEFVIIRQPQLMYLWYTILIIPLMAIRFFMYHRAKYHYFMLDFCYLCQVLLLFYLFGHQFMLGANKSPSLFKLVFALSNGPLAWGTIVWRNSLVFHDVDKLTSVFIHLCPPIVTYCLRWYPHTFSEQLACGGSDCTLSLSENYLVPLYLHVFWQIFYYVKTEVVDGVKLANDKEIMTSSRWMSIKQPHPLYKFFISRGININPTVLLMVTQLIYTLSTLITLPLFMSSFIAHSAFLCFIFAAVSWNGSCYYFEVFSESYHKRFKSDMKQQDQDTSHDSATCNKLKISSITAFVKFLAIFLTALYFYLRLIL